jgi:Short C-terminal domain
MFRRRRPLLRAAVVGGGAYMAGKATANRAADQKYRDADQEARLSNLEQQQAQAQVPAQQPPPQPAPAQPAPAQPAPAQAAGNPLLDQLNQLASLHQSGALSDDEFAAAKSKLLA